MLATGVAVALSSGAALPPPPAWVLPAALAATAGPLAALAAAKAALADDLHVELHEGKLHIQRVPVSGQTCSAEAIQVLASGDMVKVEAGLLLHPWYLLVCFARGCLYLRCSGQTSAWIHGLAFAASQLCSFTMCTHVCICSHAALPSRRYALAQMHVAEVHLPSSTSRAVHASVNMKESCWMRCSSGRATPTAWYDARAWQ